MFKRFGAPALLLASLSAAPALAHHPMESMALVPSPVSGLISGLAHPLLGPDHLLFLIALALVGFQRSMRWTMALLLVALGLWLPGLPGAEALVSLSLVVEGLVIVGRLPALSLIPAFALHGYVLSASVIGWESTPIAFYLLGLLLSQGALLTLSLVGLRRFSQELPLSQKQLLAGVMVGIGAAFTWTALVA
jgi:urease accessory protein